MALGITVSLVALGLLVLTMDLEETGNRLKQVQAAWIIPAIGVLAVQALIRAARWRVLLSAVSGGARPSFPLVLECMLVGYFFNAILPGRLGEAVRGVLVSRKAAIGLGSSAASLIGERLVDLGALLALGAVALGALGSAVAGLLAVGAAAVGLAILVARRASVVLRFMPSALPQRVRHFIDELLHSIAGLPRPALVTAAALSAVAWLGDGSLAWVAGQAMGIDLPIAAAIALALGGSVATAVPAAPGYIATYELGAVAAGGLAGLDAAVILPVAVVVHLVGVVGLAAAGGIATGRLGGAALIRASLRGNVPMPGPAS